MNDEIAEFHEKLKQHLQKLESGHPDRKLSITLIVPLVEMEINYFRKFGTVGDESPSIIGTFLIVLSQDKDPRIRADVAKKLGKMAHDIMRYKVAPFQDIPIHIEQGLVSALKDEDPSVREVATTALRKIGTPSALSAVPPKRSLLDMLFGRKGKPNAGMDAPSRDKSNTTEDMLAELVATILVLEVTGKFQASAPEITAYFQDKTTAELVNAIGGCEDMLKQIKAGAPGNPELWIDVHEALKSEVKKRH